MTTPRLPGRGALLRPPRGRPWSSAVLVVRARTPDLVLEVTRACRAASTPTGSSPRTAPIEFFVRESDDHARVAIVDSSEDLVRTLDEGVALTADEEVTYAWDGRADDGRRVRPGRYRLLVELPAQDREMIWPRRISFETPTTAPECGAGRRLRAERLGARAGGHPDRIRRGGCRAGARRPPGAADRAGDRAGRRAGARARRRLGRAAGGRLPRQPGAGRRGGDRRRRSPSPPLAAALSPPPAGAPDRRLRRPARCGSRSRSAARPRTCWSRSTW